MKKRGYCIFLINSNLLIISVLNFILVEGVYGIKCYECSVTKQLRNNNATIEQCSEFTESNKFEFDCPYSTMCEKKIVRLQLINKIQTSFERGCAKQKRTSMVKYLYKQLNTFPVLMSKFRKIFYKFHIFFLFPWNVIFFSGL